jgi:transcription termination/antitermination protein NusG
MQSEASFSPAVGKLGALGWYAAYVKHQHERKAAEQLQRKGIEVLLPLQKVVHRWKDRNKALSLPLFPSYLFIHTDLEDKWRILNTPGIFFLVETQGKASTIPLHEIESIQRLMASGLPAKAHPYLVSGDKVQIRSGALQGVIGVLDRFKNQYRVVINVELLQRAVSIEVELGNLERVPDYAWPYAHGASAAASKASGGARSHERH